LWFWVSFELREVKRIPPLLSMNCEIMIQQTAFIEENCACAY